ncbi:cyclase family protein [Frondihabitans australicus]|uniref:Kynurenine formamidase n=1 Tax=Frondihabitans australicus TaxID=386892 RepID=A0A495ID14_9MICO|nr:cyclase family protein [Frondihabitans australicus]RKR73520.1 kynurenine formamidase [Frondihabitans australicus]
MPPTLIDLSMPIVDHWRFSVSFAHKHAVAEGQPFTSTTLDIAAHAFTHVDAPSHLDDALPPLGEVDLSRLAGDAVVIDLSGLGDDTEITAEHLEGAGAAVTAGDIALLRTDHELRHPTTSPDYWLRSPYVSASAATWLQERGVSAAGFDFPQDRATRAPYDPHFERHPRGHADDWACHSILLASGTPLIEYLTNLWSLPAERVPFYALPLNVPGSDGAPVRAFATLP